MSDDQGNGCNLAANTTRTLDQKIGEVRDQQEASPNDSNNVCSNLVVLFMLMERTTLRMILKIQMQIMRLGSEDIIGILVVCSPMLILTIWSVVLLIGFIIDNIITYNNL